MIAVDGHRYDTDKTVKQKEKISAPGEIRTHGLRIRNPALYPPELRGREEYQLVTVIFFFSCVNLCIFVPDIRQRLNISVLETLINEPFESCLFSFRKCA